MPTRKKPKWGYEGRHLLSNDDLTIYTDQEIQRLVDEFQPAPIKAENLRQNLEEAAQIYRVWFQSYDEMPTPGEMKAGIDEVDALAVRLKDCLVNMDEITDRLFWKPELELMPLVLDRKTESRFGHTIHYSKQPNGDCAYFYLRRKDILEALSVITSYAAEARDNLPRGKDGPRRSQSLRMWVINIIGIWEEVFERPFTVDYQHGRAVSEAARFAVEAFKTVDVKTPESRIISAIKSVRAEKKIRTGNN
tara:strand:- start:6949 stop:7695 length:747 start_codon:yes stop_codon:yes gene_type:complete